MFQDFFPAFGCHGRFKISDKTFRVIDFRAEVQFNGSIGKDGFYEDLQLLRSAGLRPRG